MSSEILPLAQRKIILDHAVTRYIKQGYRVISQSDTTAQLVKPKRFGCGWVLLSLFSFGIAIIFYLMVKERSIYLEVTQDGRVKRTARKQ